MAEEKKPAAEATGANQSVLRLRTERTTIAYSNFAVTNSSDEDVSVMFGVHLLPMRQPREIEVEISHRIIMTWPSVKRLAITLGNLIQRQEAAHGVINVQVPPASGPSKNASPKE